MMRSHSKLEHVGRVYVAAAAAAVALYSKALADSDTRPGLYLVIR